MGAKFAHFPVTFTKTCERTPNDDESALISWHRGGCAYDGSVFALFCTVLGCAKQSAAACNALRRQRHTGSPLWRRARLVVQEALWPVRALGSLLDRRLA